MLLADVLRDSFLTTLTSPSTTVKEGRSSKSQLNGLIVASVSQVRISCGCGRTCPWLTLDLAQRTNSPLKIQELRHFFFFFFFFRGSLLVVIRAVSSFPVTRNSFKWDQGYHLRSEVSLCVHNFTLYSSLDSRTY